MKALLKRFLYRKGLYHSFKYSRPFRWYQLLFKPAEIQQERNEISFYKSFLPDCRLVFDIGANDGHKTAAFLHLAEKVISCEPDHENFKILQTRFRNQAKRVIIENIALSDKAGIAELNIHHPGSAFNTLSPKWMRLLEADNGQKWNETIRFTGVQKVATKTLDQLISIFGVPGFIKIDVEGYEESVLKGLSQPVPYLSFETLLPDYQDEFKNCLASIESLDRSAGFNIAVREKLLLPAYVSRTEMEQWLQRNTDTRSFDVIVKMSA